MQGPEEAERQGFEPWQRLHVDRLAICSITTLAPLQCLNEHFDKNTFSPRINQHRFQKYYSGYSIRKW